MRYETFGFILIGILTLVGIASLIVILKSETKQHIGVKLGKYCITWITIIVFIIVFNDTRSNYSLSLHKNMWEKYNTPQIDSLMFLDWWNNNEMRYYTLSKDSITHTSKTIKYDLFFLDKITDEFINKKENLKLQMIFIKSNLFRKESRLNILQKPEKFGYINIDTLSVHQGDSILKVWGFTEDLYKVKHW